MNQEELDELKKLCEDSPQSEDTYYGHPIKTWAELATRVPKLIAEVERLQEKNRMTMTGEPQSELIKIIKKDVLKRYEEFIGRETNRALYGTCTCGAILSQADGITGCLNCNKIY